MQINLDPLFSTAEATSYLNLKTRKTLAKWRRQRRFIDVLPPIYLGNRVFYRQSALESFVRSRTAGTVSA